MKHLLASILLLAAAWPAAAGTSRTYADAQVDMALKSQSVSFFRKTAIEAIKKQNADLEVVNRLDAAKTAVEDMIRRNNFAKACRVAEAGFTLATLGAGGIVAATGKGVSVLSREGLKIAAKYAGAGAAVEAGKDIAGVPSLSNAAQWGVDRYNKADASELKAQLSQDNLEVLLKAKQLIEDDSDGRPLEKKLPELHQMLLDAERKLDLSAAAVKGADSNVERAIKEFKELAKETSSLKQKEHEEAEKRAAEAKAAKDKEIPAPKVSKPANVPAPEPEPKESPEDKRRRMQAAINKYISSLRTSIDRTNKTADAAWGEISAKSETSGSPYSVADTIEYILADLAAGEESLGTSRTYLSLQSVERSAQHSAKSIEARRLALETQKADIHAKIEPLLTEIAGYISQWDSVERLYKPQGYDVQESPKLEGMSVWISYYSNPLKYAEAYITGTEGLAGKYTALAARAIGLKNAIYSQATEFISDYAAKLQGYKDYQPQVAGQLEKITASSARHYEVLNNLGHRFTQEFAYDGKYDLANLEAALAAAKPAFSEVQKLQAAGSLLYHDLYGRFEDLRQLAVSPLLYEAHAISYSAEDKAHKTAMAAAVKKTQGYSPDMKGTEGWDGPRNDGATSVFEAEAALRYLKAQETKLLAAYSRAISDFKSRTAADLSGLGALPDAQYREAMDKLFAPVQRAEEEKNTILSEVREAAFWGNKPWKQTGFWTVQLRKRSEELEQATGAFWSSDSGKALTDARRRSEVQQAQDTRDPGAALVRKLYEDFRQAYESRNAAKVMSYISANWTAGDGTDAADLEEQLRNVFRVFDEVKVSLSGLQVVNNAPGSYSASYNMTIRSRIYKKNIKREETSSVYELVTVEAGAAKIAKTEAGGYWEIK